MLPYFKRSEDNERLADSFHGTGGGLNVADPTWTSPLTKRFIESAVGAGCERNDDFNGAEQDGVGRFQLTQKRGRRWSAADAFLHPVRKERPNLTVATGAHAHHVVMEGTRAVGVEYHDDDGLQTVRASREVVLSAGAFNSPQLLMLSGIGPADHLRSVGIEPVVDSPHVGRAPPGPPARDGHLLGDRAGHAVRRDAPEVPRRVPDRAGARQAVVERRRGGRVLPDPRRPRARPTWSS